jgi:glycosyltransferase involved in cell wall biosynthesis
MNFSVLMSIYHKEKVEYFDKAMQSVWDEQTIRPNEVVLVQDGKLPDRLYNVINKWQDKLGSALKTIRIEENVGLAKALNTGIYHCKYNIIARMDTDDIAMPGRFKEQLEFMKINNIDMCGTNAIVINENSLEIGVKKLPQIITFRSLLKRCDIIHPSAMFKKDFFSKYGVYNLKFRKSQDYDLWLRAAQKGAKIMNMDKELIKLRVTKDLVIRRKNEQKYNIMIKKKYLSGLKYFLGILPNIAIILIPTSLLNIILKNRNR